MKINKTLFILFYLIAFSGCLPETGIDESLKKFNRQEWLNADKISGEREMMFSSLSDSILSIGMEKDSVFYYLGRADSVIMNKDLYLLSIGHDPCYLVVTYRSDLVKEYEKECW